MTRPSRISIDTSALVHNVHRARAFAPGREVIAMVKANAYGCGISVVVPAIDEHVNAFGVACLEEAVAVRALGVKTDCILIQGVFGPDEWHAAVEYDLQCVIHQPCQLQWLLNTPLKKKLKIWIKVDTGMHRLGFETHEVSHVLQALRECQWVDREIGLLTHFACADEPENPANQAQIKKFNQLNLQDPPQKKHGKLGSNRCAAGNPQ
jgi:alanine racemase